jgi:hypothetical protein
MGPDPHTLFLVIAIVYSFAAAGSLLIWLNIPSAVAMRSWSVALMAMLVSNFVVLKVAARPNALAFAVAGLLSVAALSSMWMCLRELSGQVSLARKLLNISAAITAFVAVNAASLWLGLDSYVFSAIYTLFAGALSLLTGRAARQAARTSGLYACGVVCGASYALAFIFLVRGVVVLLRLGDQIDVQSETMVVNYSRYFGMICVLVATVGLGCLAAERQIQDERRLQKQEPAAGGAR